MAKEDKDKTAFYTGERVFCYKKMLFGLKNTGATYQRLVDKVFSHQIGRNLEAYVDDMVIKSPFSGHLITKQSIKANPLKVKAVTDLDQSRTLKDIQSLNGKLAALSRFLSKGAERSMAFFKILKGCKDKKSIQWTTEANKALEKMKKLVQALPTLTAPRVGETLTMQLAASKESISVVLVAQRNEGLTLIYFVSRVLQGAELNYPALEKLVLALVHASRKLRRYFQAHTITAIELGEHDIVFLRRKEKETPADFLVEIPVEDNEKKEKPKEAPVSNSKEYTYALRFKFETTNNEVEYEALLAGLWIAQEMEIAKVAIFLETQLLVNQIKGTFIAKQTSIKDYLQKVKTALRGFEEYTIEHVRRNQNKRANALSKLALMTFEHLTKEVLVEVLTKRSIKEKEVLKEDQNPGATIQANLRKDVQKILLHAMAPLITKQGYYWPSMHKEVAKSIQDYEKCKEQSAIRKAGTSMAITAGSTLPFSHWRIHILGSLPMAPGEDLILIIKTIDNRARVQKATKGKESKEVDSIKNAYYQNKLRKYHSAGSSHPMYIVGDFVLLQQNVNEWQGPYIINEVHKEELYIIVDTINHSLV
nr:hypothetical protein [Tanacetum cinerariifolium]